MNRPLKYFSSIELVVPSAEEIIVLQQKTLGYCANTNLNIDSKALPFEKIPRQQDVLL